MYLQQMTCMCLDVIGPEVVVQRDEVLLGSHKGSASVRCHDRDVHGLHSTHCREASHRASHTILINGGRISAIKLIVR